MNREQKAESAIAKAKVKFGYQLVADDRGVCAIRNLDAYNPIMGKHTNKQDMELPVFSTDTVAELVEQIEKKWG